MSTDTHQLRDGEAVTKVEVRDTTSSRRVRRNEFVSWFNHITFGIASKTHPTLALGELLLERYGRSHCLSKRGYILLQLGQYFLNITIDNAVR